MSGSESLKMGEGKAIGKAFQEIMAQMFQILWKLSIYRPKKLNEPQRQEIRRKLHKYTSWSNWSKPIKRKYYKESEKKDTVYRETKTRMTADFSLPMMWEEQHLSSAERQCSQSSILRRENTFQMWRGFQTCKTQKNLSSPDWHCRKC